MTNEPSPRPWRITHPGEIEDANGNLLYNLRDCIGGGVDEANAALIVAAVNERDRLREELESAKVNAESEKRWANDYFAQAQKAEAERDRLRDIVRRMADTLEHVSNEHRFDFYELVREARAAIGEGQP